MQKHLCRRHSSRRDQTLNNGRILTENLKIMEPYDLNIENSV